MFRRIAIAGFCGWLCIVTLQRPAVAQSLRPSLPSGGYPLLRDDAAPGMIGAIQLQRQPNLAGHFQAIEVRGPKGSRFALACDGFFQDNAPSPLRAGLLVGAVYRLRMVGIANEPEAELYPTIEVIDRTYPPADREHRFPIPIEIDETDIEAAMRGDLVTRVIYLEDGTYAEPVSYADGPQRVFDVDLGDDALRSADALGRPVAILRIGSRVPEVTQGDDAAGFLFQSPPWQTIKGLPQRTPDGQFVHPY
jgi:hypothetical protein